VRARALALALVLLWGTRAHAASSIAATGNFAQASAEVTAAPLTMCAWFKAANTTADGNIAFLFNDGVGTNFFILTALGDQPGDPVSWVSNAGAASIVNTTSGYSSGVWHHACGVELASNSRAVYLDGGNKATASATQVPSVDALRIHGGSSGLIGQVAELGIWNAALTDAEVASLAKGFAPPCIRRASLTGYYPLVRHDGTTLLDTFRSAANGTVTGTVSVADHPRITNCQ
jgi:hypothetical protein